MAKFEKAFHMAAVLLSLISFALGTIENSDIAVILNALNTLRSDVDPTASNMQMLVWNQELGTAAQLFSQNCTLEYDPDHNSILSFNTVGETLSAINVSGPNYRQIISVAWISRNSLYTFENNTCSSPGACSSYTQLVWAETKVVGCGSTALCPNISGFPLPHSTIFICYYGPAGNIPEQHPYQIGTPCSKCDADQVCINNLCGLPAARNLTYGLNENNFTVSWVTPSSLNISSFCVNVTTSSTPPANIISQCDILQSPFSYELLQFSTRCNPINIILMSIDHVGIRREASLLHDSCDKSCQAMCDYPPAPVDGYLSVYDGTKENVVVTYSCDPGYYLSPPVSFFTCTSAGSSLPKPAFTKCLPLPKCNTTENQPAEMTSNFEFISTTQLVLVVVMGCVLFIAGAITVTISLLLILKKFVKAKSVESKSAINLVRKSKLNLHVSSAVQRSGISKQDKNIQKRPLIQLVQAYSHATSEDNENYSKYPTTTKSSGSSSSSSSNVKYHKDSRSDSKYVEPTKDIRKYKSSDGNRSDTKIFDDNYYKDEKHHITSTDSSSDAQYNKPTKDKSSGVAEDKGSFEDTTDSSNESDTDLYWKSKKHSKHQEGVLMLSMEDSGIINFKKFANSYLPTKKAAPIPITVLPAISKSKKH